MKCDIAVVVFNDIKTDARALNLARGLLKLGKKVLVVSVGEEVEQNIGNEFLQKTISLKKRGGILLNWIIFTINVIKILNEYQFSFLVASDLYALPACSITKKKSKLIYDSREIYSSLGSLKNQKVKQFIINRIERFFIQKVNRIVVSGELDNEYLSKNIFPDFQYFVIKNLPPYKDLVHSNIIREKFNLPDYSIVFIYQGLVSEGRGIYKVIEAIEPYKNIYFFIIGLNTIEEKIKNIIKQYCMESRVIIHPPVDYDKLFEFTSAADVGVCLFEPITDSYHLALPNKFFEYLMAGIPQIATNLPQIKITNYEYNAALLIDDVNNIEEIRIQIEYITNPKNREKMKSGIINSRKKLSYDLQLPIIQEIFK